MADTDTADTADTGGSTEIGTTTAETATAATPDLTAAKITGATQALRDGASQLTRQATDRARSYAEDGKARAGGAIDEFSKMLTDAAGTVDEKLGEQYGQYARSAADQLTGLSDRLRDTDIDDLVAEAREFVKKSPAIAIGAAAAVGFVIARLVKSGLDADKTDTKA